MILPFDLEIFELLVPVNRVIDHGVVIRCSSRSVTVGTSGKVKLEVTVVDAEVTWSIWNLCRVRTGPEEGLNLCFHLTLDCVCLVLVDLHAPIWKLAAVIDQWLGLGADVGSARVYQGLSFGLGCV